MIDALRMLLKRVLLGVAERVGPREIPSLTQTQLPMKTETNGVWEAVRPRTMTRLERIDALCEAVEHLEANSIPGDFVECGVWRGGSMMAVALTLNRLKSFRRLWLYDTFSGMTKPTAVDTDFQGQHAEAFMADKDPESSQIWAKSSIEDVRAGMIETGYPAEFIRYVVGPVEETIPADVPERIALLRLDTDWYESTYHELVELWPRLSDGGVLIIDDYGDWAGAKKAVDQYFAEIGLRPLLHRIDGSGRLVIKRADALLIRTVA